MDTRECSIAEAYIHAKRLVFSAGYGSEIVSEVERKVCSIDESDFLREAAWVILSVGMREAVINAKFEQITKSFKYWESSYSISRDAERCAESALQYFRHAGKISAIVSMSVRLAGIGFERWRPKAFTDPVVSFQEFPFIGAAAALHLAKNLGFDVAKPDRHLMRLALDNGYPNVDVFCSEISHVVGDKVTTVDSVLWRFATLSRNYLCLFKEFQSADA